MTILHHKLSIGNSDMTLEATFGQVCSRFFHDGLKAAIVTDRDGVMILQCISEDAPAKVLEPAIPTTFAVANNQASKLGLQRNKCIVSMYDLFQVVQMDQNPLIITLVGDAAANTGLFMNLGQRIIEMTQPLVTALQERQ
ncbi:mitogen-activated protein kinase [Phycomyces blakesleeanus]|uniref:Mitogen-activated protein kinase n=1 Tax=Phycomyces blakesleeanus TaxID=4837 RepID=A0ABR3B275_PHYBL